MATDGDEAGGHRGLRRAGGLALALLVAAVGIGGLILLFNSRDDATFSRPAGPGEEFPDLGRTHLRAGQDPGVEYNSQPPTSGPHTPSPVRRASGPLTDDQLLHALEAGDVVLAYGGAQPPPALRSLVAKTAPFSPALAADGQAVILARRPGTAGVTALAWRHRLRTTSADDPRLLEFVEFWLGRGAR